MKAIILRCGIYDCYWNIGRQHRKNGNCSAKKVSINLDYSQCSQFIEISEAQEKFAQLAFKTSSQQV